MADNNTEILDCLRKDYGIEIEATSSKTEEEIKESGYDLLSDEAVASINALLQYIPGLVVDAVEKTGAYKVKTPAGLSLMKSKTKGAYRGTFISKDPGSYKFKKGADLFEMPMAPQYALCCFDIASAITGQYYMAEINHKLESLDSKTDRILDYLDNAIKGELLADEQILDEIIRNNAYIKENELIIQSYYQQILSIKKDALAKMRFFGLQITSARNHVNTQSKASDIETMVHLITDYYPQYWYAINLYQKSVFCEIALGHIDDPTVLEGMRNTIQENINRYKTAFQKDKAEITDLVKNAATFNLWKLPVADKKALMLLKSPLLPLVLEYEGIAKVENIISNKKEENKQKLLEEFREEMRSIGDLAPLSEQLQQLDDHIARVKSPMEILQIEERTYVRYLDASMAQKESLLA